jgi:4-amino-4-deoxy-L-arabinose transferase-like glycosyltransferase
MPNLALAYGALFRVTDHLLLAARLLNTVFATLMLGAIFYYATSLLSNAGNVVRWSVGAGSVLLIVFNPLFIFTSGLAWNHDLPVLLTLLAVILYSRTVHSRQSAGVWVLVGLLIGLAVGTRLSFALAVIPFVVAIFLLPETSPRRKGYLLGAFFGGAFPGLLPAISLALAAPTTFAFDNWTYHQVNQTYWQQQWYDRAMDLEGKLVYLKDVVIEPSSMALFVAFLLLSVPAFISALHERQRVYSPLAFIALLTGVLLVGALAPSPTWYQYFYALVPFLALGVVCAFASLYTGERRRRWGTLAKFGLAVTVSAVYGLPAYLRLNSAWSPESWVPNEAHRAGMEIRQAVADKYRHGAR